MKAFMAKSNINVGTIKFFFPTTQANTCSYRLTEILRPFLTNITVLIQSGT